MLPTEKTCCLSFLATRLVERPRVFLESLVRVGAERVGPQIAVVAGRIAVAREDVQEMGHAMPHDDFPRHAERRQRVAFESGRFDGRITGKMPFQIHQRRREVLDGRKALVKLVGLLDLLPQFHRQRLACLVVQGKSAQDLSCTCPAWRNQSTAIERRTCKHLRKLRGEEAERQRLGAELPARPVATADAKDGPPLLLAQTWDNATDLTDWWMSEKLDGVRAFWDGQQFLSRQGNLFHAPGWFVAGLPDEPLDGELWIGRKQFQRTVSIVRRQDQSDLWKEVRFLVFDAPRCSGGFEARLEFLAESLRAEQQPYARLHEHQRRQGLRQLRDELGVWKRWGARA